MAVTARLRRRIESDFPGAQDEVEAVLTSAVSGNQDRERVLAAIVFIANGNFVRLRRAVTLSQQDWRDVLVQGHLAQQDWPEVLDELLGPLVP